MNDPLSRFLSCHHSQRFSPPSPSAIWIWTQISARASTTTTNLIHPSALLPLCLPLSCPNSKSGIRSSVRSYAPLRFFFILIPFPSFLPIYLSRHSDCHHHRSLSHRQATLATSRLTCSPHRGSFAATCSPSASAAAAFFASLASDATASSASRSRCC